MISSYSKANNYLNSFIDYEKKINFSYQKSLRLQRVRLLFNYLNIPYQNLKVIHIAGTKGKGSTAYFCANLLASLGFRVGLYTSPHISDFRERIKIIQNRSKGKCNSNEIKETEITKAKVIKIVNQIAIKLERSNFDKKLGKVSFFEVLTAIAFKYFLESNADFVVLETGLGGRLDATNLVNPLVSILTSIGYDHTDKLGKEIADIAFEKAGIIKKGIPVVSANQRRDALEVIKKKCNEKKSPLCLFNKDIKVSNVRLRKELTLFNFEFNDFRQKDLKLKLKGRYQVENAALALAAVYLVGVDKLKDSKRIINQGLLSSKLSARFEVISKTPLVVMDVAHNVVSFSVLKDNLKNYFPSKKVILIFACSRDKEAKKMLKKINYSRLILTGFSSSRSFFPSELKEIVASKKAYLAKDIKAALSRAIKIYKNGSLILISGSFFLVAEAKKVIKSYLPGECG